MSGPMFRFGTRSDRGFYKKAVDGEVQFVWDGLDVTPQEFMENVGQLELQVNDLKTAAANVLNAGSLLGVGVIPPMLRQELIALDQVMKKHSTKGQCNKCGEGEAVMNGLCPECIRKQGFA